jgi:hypothetical protein
MNKKQLRETLSSMKGSQLNTAQERKLDDGFFGRSLEQSLGVDENNLKTGDLELDDGTRIELKTTNGKSKMTLFSKEPSWTCNKSFSKMKDFFDLHSYESSEGRQKLNMTIKADRENSRGFKLVLDESRLLITCNSGVNYAEWDLEDLLESARTKLDNLVVVTRSAQGEILESSMEEGVNIDAFKKMIASGQIVVETRLSTKKGSSKTLRNRGTCFRVQPKMISKIYKEEK